MATANPFDILGDNENDATHVIAAAVSAIPSQKPANKSSKKASAASTASSAQPPPPKLPSKPLPPAQAVREAKSDTGGARGRGLGGGRGFGRDRGGFRGYDQEAGGNEVAVGSNDGFSGSYRPSEEGESGRSSERRGGPRGSFRGGRRGGFSNGEVGEGERPRRVFERRSGTGRGNEIKRDGAGRGNWGTASDDIAPETEEVVNEGEKRVILDKQLAEEDAADPVQETPAKGPEEEPEDKEMTLEEYEKVLEEKRKDLVALKTEERKVALDKDLKNMLQLSSKKENNDVFIKLGSDKEKQKDSVEKAKKVVSINEFLKPADVKNYYNPAGRGRGRGRGHGSRGGYGGSGSGSDSGSGGYGSHSAPAPSIEDPGHFPSLGGK